MFMYGYSFWFSENPSNYDSDRLTFDSFDVAKVLQKGARLMGSEGTEFDCQDDFEVDSRENLQRQRSLLNERLGFNTNGALGINLNDLVTLDDMRHVQKEDSSYSGVQSGSHMDHQRLYPVQELLRNNSRIKIASQSSVDALSCREMNRFKRKARQHSIQPSSNNGAGSSGNSTLIRSNSNGHEHNNGSEPELKMMKLDVKPDGHVLNNGKYFKIWIFN